MGVAPIVAPDRARRILGTVGMESTSIRLTAPLRIEGTGMRWIEVHS
jgi:hypothetical protein